GAGDFVAGSQVSGSEDGRLVPAAAGIEAGAVGRRRDGDDGDRQRGLVRLGTASDHFDRERLDDQLLALVDEAEAGFMQRLEGRFHLLLLLAESIRGAGFIFVPGGNQQILNALVAGKEDPPVEGEGWHFEGGIGSGVAYVGTDVPGNVRSAWTLLLHLPQCRACEVETEIDDRTEEPSCDR